MIKVLVADDHPVVRDGLRALFAEYPNIDLIGEAATGREAIKAAVIDKPDVIIMDLAMPDTDGFSATAEISRVAPDVAVLVLTMSDDDVTVTKAMRAGARGYLLKGATKEEILRAVTAVADGQAIFGPAVAQRVLARLGAPSTDEDPFPQLTPREHDVLRLLAQGLSNSAIADRLGLSLKTVNNNTSSIFTKLNVAGRTEAAILARDRRARHHQQVKPPSTSRSTPVQKLAASLSRKIAGPTSSLTVAIRPSGVSASNSVTCSATSGRRFIGVAV
jgi:DNA-binding NarL/FixJ family response regulator